MSTDHDWEKWGKQNPYFGVLSDEKFTGTGIDRSLAAEFYASGRDEIDSLMARIRKFNDGQLPVFGHAVDFGCGVGRLTVPLTEYARKVTGLDVSPSMLKVAQANTSAEHNKRITYAVSHDSLDELPKMYDLVYSNIVLQHIPPVRGNKIIGRLLDNLQPGGYAALQVTYRHDAPTAKKAIIAARSKVPPLHYALNAVRGQKISTPLMRMHLYDLHYVLAQYQKYGLENVYLQFSDHGGYQGAMIIGKKPK